MGLALLRNRHSELLYRRGNPCFYAFDLLWLNGRDLRQVTLIERKKLLRRPIGQRWRSCLFYADRIEARLRTVSSNL